MEFAQVNPPRADVFCMQCSFLKRFFLLLVLCPLLVHAEVCLGSHFKAQTMSINDPQEREVFASRWLKENIPTCKPEQLRSILSSSPLWLGTALTAKISGLIEAAIEAKSLNDPAALEMLLNPPLKKAAVANNSTVLEARSSGSRGGGAAQAVGAPVAPGGSGASGAIDSSALSQAAAIAAAAATAAAIVQNQNQDNSNARGSAATQRAGR